MARGKSPEVSAGETSKKDIQEQKKQLKRDQKAQKKEAKRRAKEIARQEDELDDENPGSGVGTFFITLFIVILWLAVVCIVIKLDIGGFGSSVLAPVLKDVPVVNRILPGNAVVTTTDPDSYNGYASLQEAVDQIASLERQLEQAQNEAASQRADMEALKAEVLRLQPFEEKQVEFQRIRTEFYEEVIYAEKGPGAEEYRKYYEEMDPATAEYLYKQVIERAEESKEIADYVAAYEQMKPKAAAQMFETMSNDMQLVVRILKAMDADKRGDILGAMTPEFAGRLTKMMDPES